MAWEAAIKKAMIDAGLKIEEQQLEIKEITDSVMKKLEGKKTIDASYIRSSVLTELEKKKEVAAGAWWKFDGKYKSTRPVPQQPVQPLKQSTIFAKN